MSPSNVVLSVDLGGTNLRVAAVSEGGTILERFEEPSESHSGSGAVLKKVADALHAVAGRIEPREGKVLGAVLGFPGIVDVEPMPGAAGDDEERPDSGDTLQLALATRAELDARADHQVGHGPGGDDLARRRQLAHALAHLNGDATGMLPRQLTGVHASSDLHSHRDDLATELVGTDQLQPEADHFMFLARGKAGPFRVDGSALRGTDDSRRIGVQLTLHDEGNGDRAISAATLTFRVVD